MTLDFEFSLLCGELGGYIARIHNEIDDAGEVWFTGRLDIRTGKVIEAHIGRKRIGSLNDDSIEHE